MTASSDHYFSARPASSGERRSLHVHLAGRHLTVRTAPGVFCPERLDLGTRVLLEHVPDPPGTGTLLDLGCGWGPVALTLGLLSPDAEVWAVDVNERALDLTRENARAAGVERLHAAPPEDVPGDLVFEQIWSNPPIRVGKQVLHELLLTWLPRLAAGGTAYLVVQRNLGSDSLQKWLARELDGRWPGDFEVSRHSSAKGFRVLQVDRR
ncbi:MAG TPA: methyltransferase [Segeticoccus sp.]|uniref:class I SAM-dependent methyltransferase n=1 Tax=Segeticoccus sp. TaxID=2706531 RepID=UPI002D7FDAE6|nr:methyltransferase [Segeticoccus sp.]HET8600033.1 methyltransferase [Segeticoccus sp.]